MPPGELTKHGDIPLSELAGWKYGFMRTDEIKEADS